MAETSRKVLWAERRDAYGCWFELKQHDTLVVIESRPLNCNRGQWWVNIINPGKMFIDPINDGFPRYYFDLDAAKSESEAFLRCRKVLV